MIARELLTEGYVDEIDAVRRAFEAGNTDTGDMLSDTYFELINLATSPEPFSRRRAAAESAEHRLKKYETAIIRTLGSHGMLDIYASHMQQVDTCIWDDVFEESPVPAHKAA